MARLAAITAMALISAQLIQIQVVYAAPQAMPDAKAIAIPPKPLPKWPSPCASNPCTAPDRPHWFYLQNVASVNAGSPLVLTVTTPPQPSQHNQPPSSEPYVTVGSSATPVTLQPINRTPGGDNQMWYAIEAGSGHNNPSYIISSLPPDILPVSANSSLVPQQLALGFYGPPAASSSIAGVSSSTVNLAVDGLSISAILGAVTLPAGRIPFSYGQTVSISSTPGGVADGIWTIQQMSNDVLYYSIPKEADYSPYNNSSATGTVTAVAGVYLNQQKTSSSYLNSGNTNEFQQWTYDSSDLTVCNGLGYCLNSVDSEPQAGSIVTASAKPSPVPANFQWSFYPNDLLQQILTQDNIPFPTLRTNAYNKINNILAKHGYPDVKAASCTLDGVAYTGLRCEYSNLAAPLSAYLLAVSQMRTVPVKTRRQLELELTDAIAVQNLFDQALGAFDAVFVGDQDLISQDLGDLGMDLTDQTSQKKFDWLQLLNGIIYTFLNGVGAFLGDPELGTNVKTLVTVSVIANLMSTGVDTYEGEQVSGTLPLANQFETTAADLYTNFYSRFLNFYGSLAVEETDVLTDWGKLALIGGMAQDTGRDGIAWDPKTSADVILVETQTYQINIMAQMLPQFFQLYTTMGWVGGNITNDDVANGLNSSTIGIVNSDAQSGVPTPLPTPDASLTPVPPQLLNQFATPADPQGSENGIWHAGWLHLGEVPGNGSKLADTYLTPQLAQDVQFANPYLLYNGFGLWSGFNLGPSGVANLNCDGAIVTLTNFTPYEFSVTATSSDNTAVGGGYGTTYNSDLHGDGGSFANLSNNSGVRGPVFRTLPPYGVLQVAGSTISGSGSAETQTLSIGIWDYGYSESEPAVSFSVENYGCNNGTSQVKDVSSTVLNDSYQIVTAPAVNDGNSVPGLVSVGIYRSY